MENKTTLNYYSKIKSLLPTEQFRFLEIEFYEATNDQLEAFWNIIIAGYSIDFALENYFQLYEYLENHPVEYTEALTTYVEYPGLESGIFISKTQWFELN
jgi:hypothetical protein